jgi:hypothetical protein
MRRIYSSNGNLTRATDQALADATHRLAGSVEDALTVLNQVMADPAETPSRLPLFLFLSSSYKGLNCSNGCWQPLQ